jgi:hypothetical protein
MRVGIPFYPALIGLASIWHTCPTASAVMFAETGNTAFNTSTPGDNSGWQYEGSFGFFLGVPISPHFFITAAHIPGVSVGNSFNFHGDLYTTIGFHDIPGTDLRLWEINHSKPFPTYAPLSSGTNDIGATATAFGRGTQRGTEVFLAAVSKGWRHGPGDGVKRWGRNVVTGTITTPSYGELLYCNFNQPGIPNECHLSIGDSGGGLFVLQDGLWRLAGIHLSIDGNFSEPSANAAFSAALFDCGGFDVGGPPGLWKLVPDEENDIPSSFYSSRISASLDAIDDEAPEVNALAQENYEAWLRLYFSPSQIADANLSGPLSDFDKDGINNLLEFALNLDPIFNERATMTAATGLRGLPLTKIENISGQDRLTIEFVSRSASSGAGLTYIAEFSDDLTTWQTGGTPAVTAINPRWDRVKIPDTSTTTLSPKRFARLRVVDP